MKQTRQIGARELKTRLGKYIRAVRGGETLIVTERGEPIAELRPLPVAHDLEGHLDAMVAAGLLTRGSHIARASFRPVVIKGQPLSRTLADERDRF